MRRVLPAVRASGTEEIKDHHPSPQAGEFDRAAIQHRDDQFRCFARAIRFGEFWNILAAQNRHHESLGYYYEALRLRPDSAESHNSPECVDVRASATLARAIS